MVSYTGIEVISIDRIGTPSGPVLQRIGRKVLTAAADLQIVLIRSLLHPVHKVDDIQAGEIGVLARSLLSSAPAWIAEDVDVRGPVAETCVADVVHRATF